MPCRRTPSIAWPIERPGVRAIELSALGHPVAAYPVKTRSHPVDTLVVCSGGLDSVTLAHKVGVEQRLIHLVSFDYGQRHRKELDFARACAARLRVAHDVIDISEIGRRLTGSALTDGAAVPGGHFPEETMRLTIPPHRNPIMLSVAFRARVSLCAPAV